MQIFSQNMIFISHHSTVLPAFHTIFEYIHFPEMSFLAINIRNVTVAELPFIIQIGYLQLWLALLQSWHAMHSKLMVFLGYLQQLKYATDTSQVISTVSEMEIYVQGNKANQGNL